LLTAATGFVYGRWTQRWGPAPSLVAAAERVREMPTEFGDWKLLQDQSMSPGVIETLQCAGFAKRIYINRTTGDRVAVALIVGPSGPTSVHTPEICYSSRNHEIAEPRQQQLFHQSGGAAHSLWSTVFRSRNADGTTLHVYYGWSTGGPWIASPSPRFQFGGHPLLYKIEFSTEVSPTEDGDPCQGFFKDLLDAYWQPSPGERA
jgi:hypothetical protein